MAAYFRQRVCGDRALQDGKRSKALISAFIKKVAFAPLYHRMAICIYVFVTSILSAAASTNSAIDESALTYFMWILLTAIALSGWLIVYVKVSASRRQYRKERAHAQQFSELRYALKSLTDTFDLAGLCVVLWDDATSQPKIYGRLSNFQVNRRENSAQLDFDSLLTHRARATLEHALDELRSNGHSFDCVVETTENKLISASGFISYGNALVIFQDVTQLHYESVLLEKRLNKLTAKFDLIAALLNTLAEPCWLYDEQGLTWQNDAYLQAVGTDSIKRDLQHHLFADIVGAFRRSEQSAERVKTVANINGERRHFMVNQVSQSSNSAGIAIDVTENNNLRTEVTRLNQGYSETLDLLPTAVAIFDRNMKLNFFNQAFAALWPLDTSFLESEPSHALILDKLREKGLIAEQPLSIPFLATYQG